MAKSRSSISSHLGMPVLLQLLLPCSMCKWVWVWLFPLRLLLRLLLVGRAHRRWWIKPSSTASTAVSTFGGPGPHDVGITSIFLFAQFSIRNFHNFHCCGWQKYCSCCCSSSCFSFLFPASVSYAWQIVFIPFVSYFSQCFAIKTIRLSQKYFSILDSRIWPRFRVLIASGCCVCHRA